MNEQVTKPQHWKDQYYARYSTGFGRTITENNYKNYETYGRHIISKCFPQDKASAIIDFGCGIGGFIKVCKDAGYKNIIGVDVSKEEIAFAHQFGLSEVQEGELFETFKKLGDSSKDVVLFLDVIEHFDHEAILKIFNETFRILRPNGVMIIHVPNSEGIFGSRIRYSDFTHEMAFTYKSLSQVGRYAGFQSFICFEDKPIVHGMTSLIRRILWEVGTFPFRILHAAETGIYNIRLSQNILFRAQKS